MNNIEKGNSPPDIYIKLPNRYNVVSPAEEIDSEVFADETNSSAISNATEFEIRLCGTQAFCGNISERQCYNTTLMECDQCNMGYAALFAVCCIILGLLILVGNSLVIWSVLSEKTSSNFAKLKLSLAVADLFTAINLLVVVMYNFSWTIDSAPEFIFEKHLELRGSAKAIAGGMFYLLGYTASLYHLVYMGIQRFYALVFPLKYRQLSEFNFNVGLLMVWILSIVVATSPLWFGEYVTFVYYSTLYIYLPAPLTYGPTTGVLASIILLVIFTVIPYIFMTIQTCLVAVYIRRQTSKSRKIRGTKQLNKREKSIYNTVALMQIGFTAALVPVIIAESLFYAGYLNCRNFVVPYLTCFYISMTNSLVNVLIYSAREVEFRDKMKKLFHCKRQEQSSRFSSASKQTEQTTL